MTHYFVLINNHGRLLDIARPSFPPCNNFYSQQSNSYQPSKHPKDSTQQSKCISDEYSFYNTKSQSRMVIYRHQLYRIFQSLYNYSISFRAQSILHMPRDSVRCIQNIIHSKIFLVITSWRIKLTFVCFKMEYWH